MYYEYHTFPVLDSLNRFRRESWEFSHENRPSVPIKVTVWLGHKLVSVVCLPANALAVGAGIAGMAASACTLGALKVAILFGSLGNIEPEFSTGFEWIRDRTLGAAANALINVGEGMQDALWLGCHAYNGLSFIAQKLQMGGFMRKIFEAAMEALELVGDRIETGVDLAIETERNYFGPVRWDAEIPALRNLDESTYDRSCFEDPYAERSLFGHIIPHKAYSVVNIPLNLATALVSGAAFGAGLLIGAAKVSVYALSGLNLSFPTGVKLTALQCFRSSSHVVRNIGGCIGDVGVVAYMVSDTVGIVTAVQKVGELLAKIPSMIVR